MALDEAEIEQKGRDLTKAAASPGTSPSTILAILAELRTGVTANEDILRSTRIGVTVNKIRQHKDKNVSSQAAALVSKWRAAMPKRTTSSTGASSLTSGASTPRPVANGGSSGAQSPAPPGGTAPVSSSNGSAKGKAKFTVPKEKRNAKEDGVKTNLTGNATRDACLKLMYDGLAFMSEEAPEDIVRVARAVEQAAYNEYQPETSEPYRSKMRSLFQNLKNKSNPELRIRVYNGEIKPEEFVTYTHEQLKSAERKAEDAKIMKENMDKAMVAQEEKSISTQLQCGKCGQRKVSYSQAQTRSADEPMTTFCECLNCGNRWKFS